MSGERADIALEVNEGNSGFIDKIFNYYANERSPDNAEHRLLEELRFVQLCGGEDNNWHQVSDIIEDLRSRFRYNVSGHNEVRQIVLILLKAGIVRIDQRGGRGMIQGCVSSAEQKPAT